MLQPYQHPNADRQIAYGKHNGPVGQHVNAIECRLVKSPHETDRYTLTAGIYIAVFFRTAYWSFKQ
jgi:hypothetical protein